MVINNMKNKKTNVQPDKTLPNVFGVSEIIKYVETYPNDYDLGVKVRKYVIDEWGSFLKYLKFSNNETHN